MKSFDLASSFKDLNLSKIKKIFPQLDKNIKALSGIQNHQYKNKKIPAVALIHRSSLVYWPNDKSGVFSNERFEYLGDALLNFFIAQYSMSLLPSLSEGELSKLRSKIVSSSSLASKSRALGLGACLMCGKTEKGFSYTDQESILADTFESVTAAFFIDADYEKVENWLLQIFREDILFYAKNISDIDVKGTLQHFAQTQLSVTPEYTIKDLTDDKRHPLFEATVKINQKIVATAHGKNKKEATKRVAEKALQQIKLDLKNHES